MKHFYTTFKLFGLDTLCLLSGLCVIGALTSCDNEGCEGSNGELGGLPVVVSFVETASGKNLLEDVDGSPISKEDIRIFFKVPEARIEFNDFNIISSPQYEELGVYLEFDYEIRGGTTNFIITLLDYESDTLSFRYESNMVTLLNGTSIVTNYEPCDFWIPPVIISSK